MTKVKYAGKCLLIKRGKEKILAAGDLHLGYGESLDIRGVLVAKKLFEEIIDDFKKVFKAIGKIDRIVLLGDIKHNFSGILKQEWNDMLKLFDFLLKYSEEIIVVKGNHDSYIKNIAEKRNIRVKDYYIDGKYCFMHGNKDYGKKSGIYDKKIKYWIIGHAHPAIKLSDSVKSEKYKCFLTGKYKNKNVIIVPSFSEHSRGSDPRENKFKLAWKFSLNNFNVRIANGELNEELKVLNFGKLKDI